MRACIRSAMLACVSQLEILQQADVAPHEQYATGQPAQGVASSRRLQPDGYSLWVCASELLDGGEIEWNGESAEEAVYVVSGALDVEGRECPTDGAIIIESSVRTTARALGPTRILHFGPSDLCRPGGGAYGPAEAAGHGVHVVGPGGWVCSGSREGTSARWYADSTCPTCRLCLIQVERATARDGPAHHHSQDEIIFVIGGAIGLGGRWLAAGTALFIAAGARYQLRTGDAGYRFLNYRRDLSQQVYDPADPPQIESAIARGGVEVGDLR